MADDDHHAEQQRDRVEIDRAIGLLEAVAPIAIMPRRRGRRCRRGRAAGRECGLSPRRRRSDTKIAAVANSRGIVIRDSTLLALRHKVRPTPFTDPRAGARVCDERALAAEQVRDWSGRAAGGRPRGAERFEAGTKFPLFHAVGAPFAV